MEAEKRLAEYIINTKYEELPKETLNFVKELILRVIGTTVAGATEEGCETVIDLVKEWGGKKESTILIYGGKVPAHNAACANSIMARALDYEEGLSPGAHLSASIFPTALAASEFAGSCSGKELLVAVVLGLELSAKLNSCSSYDGFDPTGVVSIFGAAAAAGRIMHLSSREMLDALALAFNKAGGSFQCNIDGVLAVRAIQGFVSQGGMICAQLAQRGITGPPNFIEGIYGYLHLYGKDKLGPQDLLKNLGTEFEIDNMTCKKYPSCGGTLRATEAALQIMSENEFSPEEVVRVDVRLPPCFYNTVGHQFKVGNNPRVNAQFSVQYCVANAILRKSSKLVHFEESYIREPKIMDLVSKIFVISDPALQYPGSEDAIGSDVTITTKKGDVYHKSVETRRGMRGNPLSKEEHLEHFLDCMSYAKKPLPQENINKIISFIDQLEEVKDARSLIPLLLA